MREAPGLGLIAAASRLVPESRRRAWRLEWEAETKYAWQQELKSGGGSRARRARLWLRVLTCGVDALVERAATMSMTGLGNDVRFALRSLLRKPGFTVVAVLTLSLGIGATTAVFTLLDGVLLSPLPFEASEELISLRHQGREGRDELPISPGLYVLYREQARTLSEVAMHGATVANLVIDGEPERVAGRSVTPSFFATLRVPPALGRTFLEEEGQPDGRPVVVLSDGLWRARFGSDPSIVGRTLDVNGVQREVVGVMPPRFGFPDQEARFWVPIVINAAQVPLGAFGSEGIARMAPGETVESVQAEIEGMLDRLPELVPQQRGGAEFLMRVNIGSRIHSLKDALVGELRTTLWILFATVGIVLLIACANVANLLLVRAEGRQRELALRVALGAGRMQVLRSFMSESVALSIAGGILGMGVAAVSVRLTIGLIPTALPRMGEIGIDARVLGFTAAVALGCALFFGFFPLLRYGTRDLAGQLREGGGARGATGGRERHRLRNGLVVSQVALALILLVGSGLMLRSFMALRSVQPGFEPEGVLTARITVPTAEIPDWQATDQFFRELRQRLEAQPGVTSVGYTTSVPLGGSGFAYGGLPVEDHPRGQDELPIFATQIQASAGYFEAMGIRLLQGRTFQPGDGGDGLRAAVIGEGFAKQWWPDASPLGRRIGFGGPNGNLFEIVGVVEDVRQSGLEEVTSEMVYFPTILPPSPAPPAGAAQPGGPPPQYFVARTLDVVIRTSGDPLALVPVLRREVRELNSRIPVANPRTMTDVFESATARTSFTMAMLGAASGIALLLGLVGIYGVISYVVSQRTREIGVRMALGASSSIVRGMVVRQGLILSALGVGLGLVASALLSRVMGSLLYGVSATDPITYIAVGTTLIAVAMVASLIPAMRAAGVDPSRALRTD